jgi:hypothetical protein
MLQTGRHFFTSESVTEGHPDKIADQISDAVLDAVLRDDPTGRVACETLVTTGIAFIAGEISTKTYVDLPSIVRQTIKEIGYTRAKFGFDYETCAVVSSIDPQSADIAQGVDTGGAGDQGMMFGYAVRETEELMPLPLTLAHRLVQRLSEARRKGELDFLRPDGKSQVTVEYEGSRALRVETVVVSTQHAEAIKHAELREAIIEEVVRPVIPAALLTADTKFHINPTGRFVIGGPQGDTGLTGRKIIVDTYGGSAPHGGGADPARLRHRRCGPGLGPCRDLRHRETPRAADRRAHPGALLADAQGNHRESQPAPADLQGDRRLRPFRQAAAGVHLGKDGSRRGARAGGRRRSCGTGGRITMSTAISAATKHDVKDLGLAARGKTRIEWA